jgi:hypothetical protein
VPVLPELRERVPLKISGLVFPKRKGLAEMLVSDTAPLKVLLPVPVSVVLAVFVTVTELLNMEPLKRTLPVVPLISAVNCVPLNVVKPAVFRVTAAAPPELINDPVVNVFTRWWSD